MRFLSLFSFTVSGGRQELPNGSSCPGWVEMHSAGAATTTENAMVDFGQGRVKTVLHFFLYRGLLFLERYRPHQGCTPLSLQEELDLIYFGRASAEYPTFCVACVPCNNKLSCYYTSYHNLRLILLS